MVKEGYDRTFKFGASDVKYFFMNPDTKDFRKWWGEKTGVLEHEEISNKYIMAGTFLEEPVIAKLNERGLKITPSPEVFISQTHPNLQVNLDGLNGEIWEIKCSQWADVMFETVKMDKWYRYQVQVQMFATGIRKGNLAYYGVKPYEYEPAYLIDPKIVDEDIVIYPIEYDSEWIESEFVPRLEYLSRCMDEGLFPERIEK